MVKYKILSFWLIVLTLLVGFFVYTSQVNPNGVFGNFPFKLGLDLAGGTELTYEADISQIPKEQVSEAMATLRDVIERRVDAFGVSEPVVQTEQAGILSGNTDQRLLVQLPGVTDVNKAIELIGKTPTLEFKLLSGSTTTVATTTLGETSTSSLTASSSATSTLHIENTYDSTGLTGRFLASASLEFGNGSGGTASGQPIVLLKFNSQGKDIFSQVTKDNVGKTLAIFLDGKVISSPTINEQIPDGNAQITGTFTPTEARDLVRSLNFGALPLPISLGGTQSIGPSLGSATTRAGVKAGVYALVIVALFLILWYRLPGLVAVVALGGYVVLILAIFKLIPVTLTAAGIAGFIMSIGMAVDANVIIFERMKEELMSGKNILESVQVGFTRAWTSIRDANITSIIIAVILFWLGTSVVKGFALTFGIGVLVSMITAITVTKTYLLALSSEKEGKIRKFLFGSGILNSKKN